MVALSLCVSVFLQLFLVGTTYALQCYNCSNIANAGECLTLEECRTGQSCYMDVKASGQTSTLGCTDNQQCGVTGNVAGSLVGRDLSSRQSSDCHECCSTDKCNKNLCIHLKLHGVWASWSDWGACSVTCGVGIQGRNRNCSNLSSGRFGDHCIGNSLGVRICLPGPCANGGWSGWGQWNICTETCGGGTQSRSRACTNPRLSPLGKYCEGDPMEVVLCNKVTCPNIVFKAKSVTNRSPTAGQTMILGTTLVNEGNAYNTSTGIFTAPVNGTYSFSTQFCAYPQRYLDIAIIVDGAFYATAHIHDNSGYPCDTADTVAVLHAHSTVWVKCTSASSGIVIIQENLRMNSFSGYLVHQ